VLEAGSAPGVKLTCGRPSGRARKSTATPPLQYPAFI
jgi:hypothetical protein